MRLLLDTHILLRALVDDPRLPERARSLILEQGNAVVVSAASIWEIAIKFSLDRASMPLSGTEAIGYCRDASYELLSISPAHAAAVQQLAPIHKDPFDRLLIAQAIVESDNLLTGDKMISQYDGPIIHV